MFCADIDFQFFVLEHPFVMWLKLMGKWPLWACGASPCEGSRTSDSFLSRSEGLDHAEGAPTRFMAASGGVLSKGYGHGGSGVCLGDGQTEAYLKDMDMTGLASAWAMARRRPI